jgi:hypothetical protein
MSGYVNKKTVVAPNDGLADGFRIMEETLNVGEVYG